MGPVRASPRPVRPGPWLGPAPHHHAGPFVSVELWYALHLAPAWSEPLPAEWEPLPPPGPGADAPPWAAEATEAAPGEASPVDTLVLAPPPELRVADRGFFAKDETVLELTWVDRQSGGPLRVKTVRAGVDPRDARKVRKLLDDALADERGWAPALGGE